jgi:membrane protein implicated in regulation of membrane protease activity
MKKNWVSWLFLENFELVVLMLITIAVVSIDVIGAALSLNISLQIRLSMVMALLALLAFHTLREGYGAEKDRMRAERDSELLIKLLRLAESSASGVECVDPRIRQDIWEDFEGDFYGWNPLFCLEQYGSLRDWLNVHKARYLNPKLREVQYLFLRDGTEPGLESSERYSSYRSFVEQLSRTSKTVKAELDEKLKTFVVDGRSSLVFFVGSKHGMDFGILYVDEPPFTKGGVPQWAFVIRNPVLVKMLRGRFDEVRGNHKPLPLESVLTKGTWQRKVNRASREGLL